MELRNGSLVGGSTGQLQQQLRPIFEEGVKLVLSRWTALCLAVENEWGGRSSKEKADELYIDILNWFYDNSEHYADDLEVELEEIMMADFNTETQDDSPRLVSKELVALHNELITGQSSTLTRLQQAAPAAVSTSLQQVVDRAGVGFAGSDCGSSESDSGVDDAMDTDEASVAVSSPGIKGPVIDDEGFELVQSRRRGSRLPRVTEC